jgi:hypothetical protein
LDLLLMCLGLTQVSLQASSSCNRLTQLVLQVCMLCCSSAHCMLPAVLLLLQQRLQLLGLAL